VQINKLFLKNPNSGKKILWRLKDFLAVRLYPSEGGSLGGAYLQRIGLVGPVIKK
jgi:hypothetical protein